MYYLLQKYTTIQKLGGSKHFFFFLWISVKQHTFCMSISSSGTVWMVDSSLLSFISSSLLLLCVSVFSFSSSSACFCASNSPHSRPEREQTNVQHGHIGYACVYKNLVDECIVPFWEALLSFSFSGLSSWASTACRSFSSSTSIAMSSSSLSSSCFTPVGFCCSALAASVRNRCQKRMWLRWYLF